MFVNREKSSYISKTGKKLKISWVLLSAFSFSVSPSKTITESDLK
jgi:hypothetical protein